MAVASFWPFVPENTMVNGYFDGRYARKLPEGFQELQRLVDRDGGFRVFNVDVKGKFMWWELGFGKLNEPTWWMHCTYGMSGRWERYLSRLKHVAALLRYSRSSGFAYTEGKLAFVDTRHFGTLKFVNDKTQHDKKLASLGPDMLGEPPTIGNFIDIMKQRPNLTLPEALMNQSIVSGVGNYVKAEALYLAQLSPHRKVTSLSDEEFTVLRDQIINVMQRSYVNKGATIQTYKTADGTPGEAQFQFNVYGRKHDAAGNEVIKEETLDGRTTHWVPKVQR